MRRLTEHLWFEVPNRRGFVNITDTVAGRQNVLVLYVFRDVEDQLLTPKAYG